MELYSLGLLWIYLYFISKIFYGFNNICSHLNNRQPGEILKMFKGSGSNCEMTLIVSFENEFHPKCRLENLPEL